MPLETFTHTDRSAEDSLNEVVIPEWAREYAASFHSGRHSVIHRPAPPDTASPYLRPPDAVFANGYQAAPGYYQHQFERWTPEGGYYSGFRSQFQGCQPCQPQHPERRWYRNDDWGSNWNHRYGYDHRWDWAPGQGYDRPRGLAPGYPYDPRYREDLYYGRNRRYQPGYDGGYEYNPGYGYGWRHPGQLYLPDPRGERYYPVPRDRYGDGRPYFTEPRYPQRQRQYERQYRQPYQGRDSRWYDDSRRTYGYDSNPYWQRMSYTIQSMVGRSIKEYDPRIPEDLGCARFVSAALSRAYGLPISDANVVGLEASLKKHGFVAVPLDQAQPGDVIIGHRGPGKHGHSAIYVGNGQIANNSSAKRRIVIDGVQKFYSREFRTAVAYRQPY